MVEYDHEVYFFLLENIKKAQRRPNKLNKIFPFKNIF